MSRNPEQLRSTKLFHARRLAEQKLYKALLERLVFSHPPPRHEAEPWYKRILQQEFAYECFAILWAGSRFAQQHDTDPNAEACDTVYSLASIMAPEESEEHKYRQYIGRVVQAAEAYRLLHRGRGEGNRKPIFVNEELHGFMTYFADEARRLESGVR